MFMRCSVNWFKKNKPVTPVDEMICVGETLYGEAISRVILNATVNTIGFHINHDTIWS